MILLDKEISLKYKNYYKKLAKGGNKYAQKELKKIEFIQKQFKKKGSELNQVQQIWKETAELYWQNLQKVIIKANGNSAEARRMVKNLKETYVHNYFSRKITSAGLKLLSRDGKHVTKIVEKQMIDAAKAYAKKHKIRVGSEKYKDLIEGRSPEGMKLKEKVRDAVFDMLTYGHAKVNPGFLKRRGMVLEPFMKNPETGKMVKMYETSLDGTMDYYVKSMSKLLATTEVFPEFTNFAGKYTLGGNTKLNLLESKFGKPARDNMENTLKIKLKRKLLGD